jgi:ABC-type Mn2+/Zn2+ transport system ATPase subunit
MQLNEVAFRYGRKSPWVLRDVSFTIPQGITEVTGRNGAGKSTLLRLLAGLRTPTRGRITGRPARVGYAPERFPVDQPFTVSAYLNHMAAIGGTPSTNVTAWAERLHFDHLLNVRLPDLSKGSAHKVGLAQALMADPALLILDEPFAGLDAQTRALLPSLITDLASAGTTVVLSDHQRTLEALPTITRLQIDNATLTPVTAPSVTTTPTTTAAPVTAGTTTATVHHASTPDATAVSDATAATQPPAADAPGPTATSGNTPAAIAPPATDNQPRATAPSAATDQQRAADAPVSAAAGPPPAETILEVVLRAEDAEAVEAKLRADGYEVRRPR